MQISLRDAVFDPRPRHKVSMKKGLVRKGQIWKSKTNGVLLRIESRSSGNFHWSATQINGKHAHHIHEGTLQKYYVLKEDR